MRRPEVLLFGVALVVGLLVAALAFGAGARRLPRAPSDQFLGPGGPDDPDRPAPRRRPSEQAR